MSYRKSIRRSDIEGAFEQLLKGMTPSETLFSIATKMLKTLWDRRLASGQNQAKAMGAQLVKVEKQVGQLLERILDANVPSVIAAYEDRIRQLEEEKLALKEKMAGSTRPKASFEQTVRTALGFLANPWNLWISGELEQRRTVLKLAFADRLRYARNEGSRTANLSLPFKMLGRISGEENKMARPKGFEPLTPRFVVWCSIQLSYGRPVRSGERTISRPRHVSAARARELPRFAAYCKRPLHLSLV